jgi:ABC-type multidrug transport system ATPase subunit
MIEFKNFQQYYGKFCAVQETNFTIRKGEVFGLLGPNGSGKTTVIKAIVGLLHPTKGDIIINGYNVRKDQLKAKQQLTYIPQRVTMPDQLKGSEVIEFFARLRGHSKAKIEETLKQIKLNGHEKKLIREYSGGLLQRLGLSLAYFRDAPVLIMDEPTLNLDLRGMRQFRTFIREQKEAGTTILFASHILADAEAFADRVGIMVDGEMVRIDTINDLQEEIQNRSTVSLKILNRDDDLLNIAQNSGAENAWFENGHLRFSAEPQRRLSILRSLEKAGIPVDQFATEEPKLDSLLIEHFGKE